MTIFVATHSVTMIKSSDKHHIILIEDDGHGNHFSICPCYPAKAIGSVDFVNNITYDAIFFVEDDMARTLLKKMIGICCAVDQRFMTITNSIIPVGGYRETAKLAINTRRQLFSQSRVCAVWDDDVFSETIPANPEVAELYNTNRDLIFNIGCTPEVWLIERLEDLDATIVRLIRERFFSDPTVLTASEEYRACNSSKPRKRAKQKLDLVIKQLSAQCGDSEEVVLDAFVEIFVSNALTQGQIKSIVAPMLQC